MSVIRAKLEAKKAREDAINRYKEKCQAELDAMVEDHKTRTREDFGMADGDIVSIESLVEVLEKTRGHIHAVPPGGQ